MRTIHSRTFSSAGAPAICVLAAACVVLGACDRSTGEIVREIDAAREGCSEEQLRTADEACVRMFERFAEMGSDAIETYIGAMRALDQAVQRRPDIPFDTTSGLGRAITDRYGQKTAAGPVDAGAPPRPGFGDEWPAWREAGWAEFGEAASLGRAEGRWDGGADVDAAAPPSQAGSWERPAGRSAGTASPTPPARRGVLLPSEQRLRRPWVDGEADRHEDRARERMEEDEREGRGQAAEPW